MVLPTEKLTNSPNIYTIVSYLTLNWRAFFMNYIKPINLLVSFLLELGLLALAGYWGFQTGEGHPVKYVYAIALPAIIGLLWGIWAAPKSKRRLKNPARTVFKLTMMALAVFFAYDTGHPIWALTFAVITAVNVSLAYLLTQDY